MRKLSWAAAIFLLPVTACAQQSMSSAQQIALAILPLPKAFRNDATVMGYDAKGKFVVLRKGTGAMTCLMSDPKSPTFNPACYQNSMEPFMARGRELRGQGVKNVDSVRFAEVAAGEDQGAGTGGHALGDGRADEWCRCQGRNRHRCGEGALLGLHAVRDGC